MELRADFPLLANNPGLHYLDSAATSQKPQVVLDALRDFYETANANPHRGVYSLSVRATECYHQSRARIAEFLGVRDSDCLIFTRGTTEGLNLVAWSWGMANVEAGDEIVVTGLDHHANFVPWQVLAMRKGAKFRICELTPDGRIDLDFLSGLLNERTKVVAFNHVSNALGTINPIAEIARLVREKADAILVCDGAQSAPHFPVSFDSLGVDFYAFSGHKMLGPMGIGGLIGKREMLEEMPPYQTGGDMIEFVHDERTTWNILPLKFEAGTPNAANAVGLAAAVEYLDNIGMDRVLSHERALMSAAQKRLAAIEGLHIYGPPPSERSGVLSFTLGDVHPHDIATILDGEGVCIRAGHHCAQPLMRRLDVTATARASFYVYNDESDIDALVAGILKAREIFGYVPV
ncbi:MAG: cysteine desulfurase CsdA [Gemmatimonadetes bacterium]|nr:MAG: cysteine desulfurase CsdA [Gemmatimonadota bacterium]PYP52140.1 MAG: cysteine desulfurase CsdA [Gemmatimonadota bacterium]